MAPHADPQNEVEAVTDTTGVTIPDPLSAPLQINQIYGRRKKALKSQWGIAAPSSSDQFKSVSLKSRPKSKRWDRAWFRGMEDVSTAFKLQDGDMGVKAIPESIHCLAMQAHARGNKDGREQYSGKVERLGAFKKDTISDDSLSDHLSTEALSRKGNSLKQAAKYLGKPGLISLGGGLPSSEYFPFDELTIKVPQIGKFNEDETHETGVTLTTGKHDLAEDKSIFDIATAFNYGQGTGAAQLLRWITEHTEHVHHPPYQDWQSTMTVGSTSALDMSLRILCERGDYIISEEYTFATAVETAQPLGVKVVGTKMDEQGLLPDSMDEILTNWDPANYGGARKPHVLYTVPSGQNPTGATQGEQRRRDIYRIAQKHDLYIIEDEPYYFLQMAPYNGIDAPAPPPPSSHEEFLSTLVPSLLSMDVDGRVMRMDSFSKVISPGSRVGWITASEQIVNIYKMYADVSTQGPSGISQLLLFKLLDEHWGHEGYLDWLIHIRLSYTQRRNVILDACERFLPRSVVSWVTPAAGMFHWMKIDWQQHPHASTKTVAEIEEEIFMASIEKGALVMRGSWFYAQSDVEHDTMFFRATYAAAPFDKIQEAIKRFGEAVRESFAIEEAMEGVEAKGTNRTKRKSDAMLQ